MLKTTFGQLIVRIIIKKVTINSNKYIGKSSLNNNNQIVIIIIIILTKIKTYMIKVIMKKIIQIKPVKFKTTEQTQPQNIKFQQ